MRLVIVALPGMMYLTSCASSVEHDGRRTRIQHQKQPAEISNEAFSFLPEGTVVHSRTEEKITCFLPRDMEVQGIMCRGGGHGWQTTFYANGQLEMAWLAQEEEIQGVPCMAASFLGEVFGGTAMTCFHDNGKLARCKVARNVTIEGHAFKEGDHVSWDREGRLITGK